MALDSSEKKTIRRLATCFLMFFALRVVEELAIIPLVTDTMGLIACGGGLIVMFLYIRFIDKPLDWIGLQFRWKKIRQAFVVTILLNIIPMLLVYSTEFLYYKSFDGVTAINFYYDQISHAYSVAGPKDFIAWLFYGLILAVLHSAFYELTFRGLILSMSQKSFSFTKSNWIQSVLYTLWYLVTVGRVALYYAGTYGKRRIITLLIFTIIYELLAALKLGMLRDVMGTVWICLLDHVAFSYIFDLIHIQYTMSGNTFTDYSLYYRMIGYQVISLIVAFVIRKRKLNQQHNAPANQVQDV